MAQLASPTLSWRCLREAGQYMVSTDSSNLLHTVLLCAFREDGGPAAFLSQISIYLNVKGFTRHLKLSED